MSGAGSVSILNIILNSILNITDASSSAQTAHKEFRHVFQGLTGGGLAELLDGLISGKLLLSHEEKRFRMMGV